MSDYHVPVMLQECIDGLNIKPNGIYVDLTYGGGGHSKAILNQLNEEGVLVVFDQDADAVKNRVDDKRLLFCNANFKYLQNFCAYYHLEHVDGILADLGVSSHQINEGERGFSFRFEDAELDMRMNRDSDLTAKTVLNSYDQKQLAKILSMYGEVKRAFQLAKSICDYRKMKPIERVADLEEALQGQVSARTRHKELAQIYQAVRIEVNGEMEALRQMLEQCESVLASGGRLVVMSYHSLEDRMVKHLMSTGNVDGVKEVDSYGRWETPYKLVTKKPIVASDQEQESNPRSRSAKLRIAERV